MVLDSALRTPLDSNLVLSARDSQVVVATLARASADKMEALREAGVQVMIVPERGGHIALDLMLSQLGEMGIDSLIVEGGPTVHAAFFREGLVNAVQLYMAPMIFGGQQTPSPIGSLGLDDAIGAPRLSNIVVTQLGDDVLIEGEVL